MENKASATVRRFKNSANKRDDGGDLLLSREDLDQLANAWPRLEVVRVDLHGAPSIEGDVAKVVLAAHAAAAASVAAPCHSNTLQQLPRVLSRAAFTYML